MSFRKKGRNKLHHYWDSLIQVKEVDLNEATPKNTFSVQAQQQETASRVLIFRSLQKYFFGRVVSTGTMITKYDVGKEARAHLWKTNLECAGAKTTCKLCRCEAGCEISLLDHVCSQHLNQTKYFQWPADSGRTCKVCAEFQGSNPEDLKAHYSSFHSVFELLENGVQAWQVFDEDDEHFVGLIAQWLEAPQCASPIPFGAARQPGFGEVRISSVNEHAYQLREQVKQERDSTIVISRVSDQSSLATPQCPQVGCESSLNQHLAQHVQAFTCDECGKSFSSDYNLGIHKKLHDEKHYSCDICGQEFISELTMLIHKEVHSKEKPVELKFGVLQQPVKLPVATLRVAAPESERFTQNPFSIERCELKPELQAARKVERVDKFTIPTYKRTSDEIVPLQAQHMPAESAKLRMPAEPMFDCPLKQGPKVEVVASKPSKSQYCFFMKRADLKTLNRATKIYQSVSPAHINWLKSLLQFRRWRTSICRNTVVSYAEQQPVLPELDYPETGIEPVETSEVQGLRPYSDWQQMAAQEHSTQSRLLEDIRQVERQIQKLSKQLELIRYSEVINQDALPDPSLHLEQEFSFKAALPAHERQKIYNISTTQASSTSVDLPNFKKIKALFLTDDQNSKICDQYKLEGSFILPEALTVESAQKGRFRTSLWGIFRIQNLIDTEFKRPLTRIQMTAVVKQVMNLVHLCFSNYVDFAKDDHNVDLLIPDEIVVQLNCLSWNTFLFAFDTHFQPEKVNIDFLALMSSHYVKTFYICPCGRLFKDLFQTVNHRRTFSHTNDLEVFEAIYRNHMRMYEMKISNSATEMGINRKAMYNHIRQLSSEVNFQHSMFQHFPVRHPLLEVAIMQIAKITGIFNFTRITYCVPWDVIQYGILKSDGPRKGQRTADKRQKTCFNRDRWFESQLGIDVPVELPQQRTNMNL